MHLSSLQLACVALATLALATAAPPASPAHHVARRSFFNLQCRGVYDAAIFARLDRICDDCYTLFRESELYNLCRKDCFTTDYFKGYTGPIQGFRRNCFTTTYFKGCIKSLYLHDEEEQIDDMVDFIGRR
ncbi:crustacean CHH/MIH/GIH neurohormone family domain-containing protein [Phthorimaea operculella]|nr:crustacean CHH/MIH/GIH neurohormone family domain-containing protein [Phthorimaea operculella]